MCFCCTQLLHISSLFRLENEEEERRQSLQLYVFVAKCIAYHFNAKQPNDMAKRQLKVTKQELARVKDRFQAFLRGETQIAADEAFTKAIESYFEVCAVLIISLVICVDFIIFYFDHLGVPQVGARIQSCSSWRLLSARLSRSFSMQRREAHSFIARDRGP